MVTGSTKELYLVTDDTVLAGRGTREIGGVKDDDAHCVKLHLPVDAASQPRGSAAAERIGSVDHSGREAEEAA